MNSKVDDKTSQEKKELGPLDYGEPEEDDFWAYKAYKVLLGVTLLGVIFSFVGFVYSIIKHILNS